MLFISPLYAQEVIIDDGDTVNVPDDESSPWNLDDKLTVGHDGTGILNIVNGQVKVDDNVDVSGTGGGDGEINVSDGGHFDITSSLRVGASGIGRLNIDDATVTADGTFQVGQNKSGAGVAVLTNGSQLKASYIRIGTSGNGQLIVDGSDSKASSTNTIWIGVNSTGLGRVTVTDGGKVIAPSIDLGFISGSSGMLNIGAPASEEAAAPGIVGVDTVHFGEGSGQLIFNHDDRGYVFDTDVETSTGSDLDNATIRHLSGTTHFTGDGSGFVGELSVEGGIFHVQDSISGEAVVSGGTLKGSGSVGAITVENSGMVSPGNAVGLLNATDDVEFQAGSIFRVYVDDNDMGRLATTGKVLVQGGDVSVVSLEPDGDESVLGTYTVIESAKGIDGEFDGIEANYAFLDPSLNYSDQAVELTLDIVDSGEDDNGGGSGDSEKGGGGDDGGSSPSPTPSPSLVNLLSSYATSGNAQQFASALENVDTDASGYQAFENALLLLETREAGQAAEELSGSDTPASQAALSQLTQTFSSSMQGRMSGATSDTPLAAAAMQQLHRGDVAHTPDDVALRASTFAPTSHHKREMLSPRGYTPSLKQSTGPVSWARAVSSDSRLSGEGALPGVSSRSTGVHAGSEVFLADELMVGVAFGTERGQVSGHSAESEFDAYSAGLYARRYVGDWRLSGSASLGWLELESERYVTGFGRHESDYDAIIGNVDAELAYDLPLYDRAWRLSPLMGVTYTHTQRDGYQEDGIAGLDVESSQTDSVRGRLGGEIAYRVSEGAAITGRLAWSHELGSPGASTEASLLGSNPFTIEGQTIPANLIDVGVGVEAHVTDRVDVYAAYDGRLGRDYEDHAGQVGMRWQW